METFVPSAFRTAFFRATAFGTLARGTLTSGTGSITGVLPASTAAHYAVRMITGYSSPVLARYPCRTRSLIQVTYCSFVCFFPD